MLDIKFVRENKDIVKDNIKKKFQDEKLPLVDEVVALDEEFRKLKNNWVISLLSYTSTILNVQQHTSGCFVCLPRNYLNSFLT